MFERVAAFFRKARVVDIARFIPGGKAQFKATNDRAFAEEGYMLNAIAYSCIDLRSKALASVDLGVKVNGKIQDQNHPLNKLLKKPNPVDAGAEFFHRVNAHRDITGNTFIEKVGGDTGPPRELWSWSPYEMRVFAKSRLPTGFIWEKNGQKFGWEVDQFTGQASILQWKTFAPLDEFVGMSPMRAASMSVDQHNASSRWNFRSIENAAVPSGFLFSKKEPITEPQVKQLRKDMEENFEGPDNAKRVMIGHGNMEWKQISMNPVDMDWLMGHANAAREIATVYRTPAQLVGILGDQTFNNYKEARAAFYEDTVIVLLDALVDELNSWLAPDFGKGTEIFYDINSIPALEGRRMERMKALETVTFMSDNEKRGVMGMPDYDPKSTGADLLFTPVGSIPVGFDLFSGLDTDKTIVASLMDLGIPEDEAKAKAHEFIQPKNKS